MPAYSKGDRVEAKTDIVRGSTTIPRGTRGRVTADSRVQVSIALVKFNGDAAVNYRIVPKVQLRRV